MPIYDKKKRKLQYFFLVLHVLIYLQLIIGVSGIAHNYCPQAAVCFGCLNLGQNLGTWMFPGAIITGLVIFLATIFIGRQYCGTVCPFGIIQDLVFRFNRKSSKVSCKTILPVRVHNLIKNFKYIVLLWMISTAILGLNYLYMPACPVMALGHIQNVSIFGIVSLFLIFVGGIFIERLWCNYFCPFGALLNISQWIGKILHLPRKMIVWNKDRCINCDLCNNFCPMRIDVKKYDKVSDVDCIHCNRCTLYCPVLKKDKQCKG